MATGRKKDNTGMSRDEATVQFTRSGYDLDMHPAHLVRRAHQRATQHFQQVMDGDNLSPTQFAALATILRHGAISQNHLGRMTSMDPSTISVVVRKLMKDGLVRRKPSTRDQRLTILMLTDRGQDFTLARLALSIEVGRRLLSPLDPREAALFLSLLRRICAEEADAPADPAPAEAVPETEGAGLRTLAGQV
jgi:DNA-binding MarR family transcriptional regulator